MFHLIRSDSEVDISTSWKAKMAIIVDISACPSMKWVSKEQGTQVGKYMEAKVPKWRNRQEKSRVSPTVATLRQA